MLRDRARITKPNAVDVLVEEVQGLAHPLTAREDLGPMLERIGEALFVLTGEASHGTSEYYLWRARLSSRLIAEKGFDFVAVEGDWPDCYRLNRYVKGYPEAGTNAREVLHAFNRWPTWMWANWEIVAFAEWIRKYNKYRRKKAGFYVPTVLPRRYDAFLYVDETQALHPLHVKPEELRPPDLYPWGV
jgi:erythromycin esterase-like protein